MIREHAIPVPDHRHYAVLTAVETAPERAVFWLTFVIYLAFWNPLYYSPMTQVNLDLAWSIAQKHSVEIFGSHQVDYVLVDGHARSGVSPGGAFVALPVALLAGFLDGLQSQERLTSLHMLVSLMLAIPFGAATAAGLVRLIRLQGATPLTAAASALLFALGTNQFAVALSYSKELIGAGVVVAVLLGLARSAKSRSSAFLAGLGAGVLPLLHYSDAMLTMGLAVYCWWTAGLRRLLWFGLGAMIDVGVLGVYQTVAFGSPWLTAYDFPHAPFEVYGRLNSPRDVAFLAFSPGRLAQVLIGPHGFLMGNPVAVAGLIGLGRLARRDRSQQAVALFGLSLFAVYAVAYTMYRYDGVNGPFLGWRFLHVLLPVLALGFPAAISTISRPIVLALSIYALVLSYFVAQAGYLLVAQTPWDKYLYMGKIWLTSLGGGVFFADFLPRVFHVPTLHHGFHDAAQVLSSGGWGEAWPLLAPLVVTQWLFAVIPLTLWGTGVAVTGLLLGRCSRRQAAAPVVMVERQATPFHGPG